MGKSAARFFLACFALLSTAPSVHGAGLAATKATNFGPEVCALEPRATVSDACTSYADLEDLNARLNPFLKRLVSETDFFSFYRLNLYNKKCPFWSDENGLCGNIACAVTTLENEEDVPALWRAEELSRLEGPKAHHPGRKEQREHPQRPLHGELGEDVTESCVVEYDDECDERDYCVPEDESAAAKGDYVSLVDNRERFTGYAGEGAQQVWEAIYRENCFSKPRAGSIRSSGSSPFGDSSPFGLQASADLRNVMKEHGRQQALQTGSIEDYMEFEDECLEKRVFYRVISGMHASISTHLCYDYLNQTTGKWGPNLQCYKRRLHEHPERLSNLYFNYALTLRAVGKLKDYIQDYTFCSGHPNEDRMTKQLISALASRLPAGPEIFDESVMFQDNMLSESGLTLKEDFRNRFRNISRIMDCVGCDKCRLWGKVQTAGYGTALKVLFEFGTGDPSAPKPMLRRTELVALMNTLEKISSAIKAIQDFRVLLVEEQQLQSPKEAPPTEAETDDDDTPESNTSNGKTSKQDTHNDESIGEVFRKELDLIWQMYWLVLRSWAALPKKLATIAVSEVARAWNYWLGLPVRPRTWEIKFPSRDEL